MTVRSRTVTTNRPKGYLTTSTGSVIGGSYPVVMSSDTCTDITGTGDGAPLTIEKWAHSGGIIHGKGSGARNAVNYVADALGTPANWPHMSILGTPFDSDVATQAAARTNPSSPITSLPNAVFELREIADLIKQAGRDLLSQWAVNNIKLRFGIAPLVQDLHSLLDFQDHLDRRVDLIRKLQSKGIYKKTVTCWKGSVQGGKHVTFQSNGISIGAYCTGNTLQTVRCHCRWYPTTGMDMYRTQHAMRALARKAVLGLTMDMSTLWEALPWSWFMDWGSNVGQLFAAHRNVIPCSLHPIQVMRHTLTTWESPQGVSSASTGRMTMSAYGMRRETKTRSLHSVAPSARLPLLNGGQLSILASLSIISGGRR